MAATSRFHTEQYASSHFTDSAGAILFHLPTLRVCLVHLKKRNEWLLPKGRRNSNESRAAAALREITEETGVPCRLLSVAFGTRAPPAVEGPEGTPDGVRGYEGAGEPFMLTVRKTGEEDVKLIWWYVAAVVEEEVAGVPEEGFGVGWFGYEDALLRLTYQEDRDVVARAIAIVEAGITET